MDMNQIGPYKQIVNSITYMANTKGFIIRTCSLSNAFPVAVSM